MSKNIVIQEGGLGVSLTVDKLKTNLMGGGTCNWIPEDAVELGTKHITEDGTYNASDDGLYGYSEVTVSGIGTASGTGPDGEDHSYSEDGEGGVTDTVLPHSISVVTPPTVTTYPVGATIDFSGMVVKGFLKSGSLWTDSSHPNGIIPISELILPVTTASGGGGESDHWTNGSGVNALLVSYTPHYNVGPPYDGQVAYVSQTLGERSGVERMYGGNGPTQFFATLYNGTIYIWGSTANRAIDAYEKIVNGNNVWYHYYSAQTGSTGTGELKTFSPYGWETAIPNSTVAPTGQEDMHQVDTIQHIPVQYMRHGDGRVLETNFDITVT